MKNWDCRRGQQELDELNSAQYYYNYFLNLFIGLLALPSIMVPVPHVGPWEY